jgi:hypothetical protein
LGADFTPGVSLGCDGFDAELDHELEFDGPGTPVPHC